MMMKTNTPPITFTPGPWKAVGQRVVAPDQPKITWGSRGQFNGDFIVVQTAMYTSAEGKEALANARLIAAAPELLEALKQFADCDLNDGNCASLEVANKRIRNIARAAINKALSSVSSTEGKDEQSS